MPELTPEEKAKIYEEEKVRAEARAKAEKEIKKKKGKWGCLTLIGLFILIGIIANLSKPKVPSEKQKKVEETAQPKLQLLEWSWRIEYDHAIAEGRVKNISNENLENIEAVVTYKTKDRKFITSNSALIDYNPILAGQISPFKTITQYNPEMCAASIDFKTLFGGSIEWIKK